MKPKDFKKHKSHANGRKMKIQYHYDRTFQAHSEWQVQQQLESLNPNNDEDWSIFTSTIGVFFVVRAYCYQHSIEMTGSYQSTRLNLDRNRRMTNWSDYPDLNIYDDCLEILLGERTEKR